MRTTLLQSHMENEMDYKVNLNLLCQKESNILSAGRMRDKGIDKSKKEDYEQKKGGLIAS